ncbi:TIGR02099 family protein [Roseateles sp. DAIF2]|uniref:YhdP family protein n=1 Tax=Roseateles sp. DAIF2 TaxID=2714952 RepID=UPI0018A33731|nr:YhdP family protein [Roseateles sp. DAIF2]QPF75959.1 TIGR02099 family protein [Roseateles sp. DAIF2]
MSFTATVTAALKSTPGRLAGRSARWLLGCGRWILGLLLLVWTLLLAAWLLLHWAILPHINEWRPDLERLASQTLGVRTEIGEIEVRSGGWIPALELRDVRFLDPAGREALRLPRVAAALSARSLWALELRFAQLLIDRPELEVRRDAQGRVFVAGLSMEGQGPSGEAGDALADWFFAQHEFVIQQGRVRWIDEKRGAAPLELSGLDLVLRNGLRRHELRLDATPPAEWGQRFSLRGRFTQSLLKRPGELRHWSGQLYAELPRADVRQLRRHVDLPFELDEGDGALRAWADFKQGEAQALTLDMGLRAVKLRLGADMEPLALARIEGRLALARNAQGFNLNAHQLGFELAAAAQGGEGLVWPRSDWALNLKRAPVKAGQAPGPLLGGELSAQRLDLALMSQIATRLPFGASQRRWLAELAPQGLVSELSARWDGPLEAPTSYRVKAGLSGLVLEAKAQGADIGRPGLANASLQLDASERGGQARLAIQDGSLEFPGVFEEPVLPLQRFHAMLDWRIEPRPGGRPPAIELRVSDVKLANADLRGELEALWKTGAGGASGLEHGRGGRFPGHLDLNGRLDQAQAARVARYLPLGIGNVAREYVRDAIRGGEARQVQFKARGDLWDFPFDAVQQGQFRISTQAQDLQLAYVPGVGGAEPAWPAMDKLSAELVFERGSMQIKNGRARVLGYELHGVNGGIKDLMHQQVLELEGQGRGPMSELLRFTKLSPVGEWIGGALKDTTASGAAQLRLGLQIPLNDVDKAQVKGQVLLAGNDVRMRPDVPLLGNARARIEFDRRGVNIQGGAARVLGGDASFEGGTQRDGSLRFNGQGVVTAEALRRAGELGPLARLAQSLNGQTAYRLQLGFKEGGGSELSLSSSLQGLGAELPAPLAKAPESQLPLRYQTTQLGNGRDELRLELGAVLAAQYQRDISGETPRVLAGSLALQDKLPSVPAQGVALQANLGQLNLDAWQAVAQRLQGGGTATAGGGAADALEGGGYAPTQIALRAQGLVFAGRPLSKVVAGITRVPEQGLWRANLDAEQLNGYLELRPARGAQPARVHARLARLSLPKSEADSVSQLLEQPQAGGAGQLPALDIVVEDFELRGKRLGRLEVDAQAQGPQREWKLGKLQLRHPDAVLNATGQWLAEPGRAQRRTVLDWKLEVADAGNLLERLGQGRLLRGGKGQASGQLGWLGSPLAPDYPSMSGQLHLALDAGQFLQAEPGVGRLLGILSLQSLPRRLVLDFRDVFSEGFAFDGFSGDVKIAQGVASSNNLRMSGVQAVVVMEGQADLAKETQDLRVLVVPEINAGGASLAYAAINPAVGLGTFLAQLLLRRPMMAASTREFRVTGSWDDPKVERVERKPDAELPAAASTP